MRTLKAIAIAIVISSPLGLFAQKPGQPAELAAHRTQDYVKALDLDARTAGAITAHFVEAEKEIMELRAQCAEIQIKMDEIMKQREKEVPQLLNKDQRDRLDALVGAKEFHPGAAISCSGIINTDCCASAQPKKANPAKMNTMVPSSDQ